MDIKDYGPLVLIVAVTALFSILAYASLTEKPEPSKTHYSVCLENTFSECVLANKSLPSLETYCKIYTELQCKELKL